MAHRENIIDLSIAAPDAGKYNFYAQHGAHGSNICRPHTCRNCGCTGHLYKDCTHPITSFGIVCYRILNGQIQYLVIQRKDSLSFMEFIRGKYDFVNIDYIRKLLSNMTMSEREMLMTKSFYDLWNLVWYQPSINRHTQDYLDAQKKFEYLKKGYRILGLLHDLASLIQTSVSPHAEPEWGFPKGRRRIRESDLECGKREFGEETSFTSREIEVSSLLPYEEIFYGTNNILYRHVYYIAKMKEESMEKEIIIDPKNINQAREVRQICWFTYEEVFARIRQHNVERKLIFEKIHKEVTCMACI